MKDSLALLECVSMQGDGVSDCLLSLSPLCFSDSLLGKHNNKIHGRSCGIFLLEAFHTECFLNWLGGGKKPS